MGELPAQRPASPPTRPDEDVETTLCVLGSRALRGPWQPPETTRAVSVLGSILLDFREAELPSGVTEVDCEVYLGSIEIRVPPGVDVELLGQVFLGSVEARGETGARGWLRRGRERLNGRPPAADEPLERPLLSIDCTGALGSVEVVRS